MTLRRVKYKMFLPRERNLYGASLRHCNLWCIYFAMLINFDAYFISIIRHTRALIIFDSDKILLAELLPAILPEGGTSSDGI